MANTSWKLKNHEKNNYESHINIFRSLEIENYLKQSLKKKGFNLYTYKLNISNNRVSLLLFIYEKQKNKIKQNVKKRHFSKDQELLQKKEKPTKNKNKTLKKFGGNLLKSIKQLMGNKFHIISKIKVINKKFITKTVKQNTQNQSFKIKLDEMKKLYLMLTTQKNSAELLGTFIAQQLKITKRHNFFLNFLTNSLKHALNSNNSRIKGIKIRLKGRLNNAPRSQNRIIQLGKLPITTQNLNLDYTESISFTSNGTIGIKIWINQG